MQNYCPRFCVSQNFSKPVPTTWDKIKELMKSTQVVNTCRSLSILDENAEDYQKRKKELKNSLPTITVHASHFFDGKRSNDTAVWNGMVCLEYDHLTPEEIRALRNTQPPTEAILLAGRSCSGTGVFFIIEVPNADFNQMKSTLEIVHEEYAERVKRNAGIDISHKVDIQLDIARLRFLPDYQYIWWDKITDFTSQEQAQQPYLNMYREVIELCDTFNTQVPVGQRNTTYKEYMLKVAQITNNTSLMLRHIPSLGLSEEERMGLLNWGKNHIEPIPKKAQEKALINTKKQPIDNEALPFPRKYAPELIQVLTKYLPKTWQASAALCLFPALSAACAKLYYEDGKPLVFQVALYGLPQSGKTAFSAKPATIVQDYISRKDNEYRKAIEKDKEATQNIPCPRVLAFTDTSIVQMMKYLQYAKDETVLAYEGDLSSALAGKESAFLDIKKILRKGFDAETSVMDYKNETGFRGSIKTRLSALVIGTPDTIFNYFNAQSTTEGNSRRVILVEHEMIMKNITNKNYTQEELDYIYQELDYL